MLGVAIVTTSRAVLGVAIPFVLGSISVASPAVRASTAKIIKVTVLWI